ncbi:MAG: hypothetical protein ACOCV2_09600 [Persicimonas sp.]
MADGTEFRAIKSDEEAGFLMPGRSEGLHLVLFCEPDSPTVDKAREYLGRVEVPDDWRFVHLIPSEAPETTEWFGLSDTMGMAVIADGAMLAVEYECSLGAFKRLMSTARKQYDSLQKLG